MANQDNFQQMEAMRVELQSQKTTHQREVNETKEKLKRTKKRQTEIEEKYYVVIASKHSEILEETRKHLNTLNQLEERNSDGSVKKQNELIRISKETANHKLRAANLIQEILMERFDSRENYKQDDVLRNLRADSVKIERKLTRLKLLVANKMCKLAEAQIFALKPLLIIFQLNIQDVRQFCDRNLCIKIEKEVANVSYSLEDVSAEIEVFLHNPAIHFEILFHVGSPKNLSVKVEKLRTSWNSVQQNVNSIV